jgi:stearoyl-CoA desaturase (delta-9 desaturase)
MHVLPLTLFWTGWPRGGLVLCLALLYVRGLCMSAGYHRYFSHRSYKTHRWFQFLLAFGGCTALRGGPLWWASLHRFHHRHSDGPDDVITSSRGFWWCYAGWIVSGKHQHTAYALVRDLAKFPELRLLNRYWLAPPALLALTMYLMGGWALFVAGFCISSVVLFHTQALLDGFNHTFGAPRFDTGDLSKNSPFLAVLGMGEGWHNNHHHYPLSARFAFFPGERDHTFVVLRLLTKFGLVWDVREVPEAVLTRKRLDLARPTAAPGMQATCADAEWTEGNGSQPDTRTDEMAAVA